MEDTKITYTLEFEDWVAFNQHHNQNWPYARRVRWLIRILLSLVFVILALLYLVLGDMILFFFFVLMALVWFFGLPWLFDFSIRQRLKKLIAGGKNMWLGRHEMTISPDMFSSKNDTGEGKYNWQTVEKIDVTKDYIFIYVTPVSALIIPGRSFKGEISFTELARLSQKYFQASEGK